MLGMSGDATSQTVGPEATRRYAPLVVDSRNATQVVQHSRHKIWKA